MSIILYQFAGSPFCEKVRWALDYKSLPYIVRNQLIGPHVLQARRLAPKTTLPILRDGHSVIQGSAEILYYLDQQYPTRLLTPSDLTVQAIAWEWEQWLDQTIGIELYRLFYVYLATDPALSSALLNQAAPWYGKWWYKLMLNRIKQTVNQQLAISAKTPFQAQERLYGAFKRLNTVLAVRPFLVTDYFSRVDLTAAALLAPLCLPPEHPFHYPPLNGLPLELQTLYQRIYDMRFFQWVLQMYQYYRLDRNLSA
jgi:glutathione S-transferase